MTLTLYTSTLLADIEPLLGPRHPSFTLVGIEIDATSGARPCLWYPDSGIAPDDPDSWVRHAFVQLGSNVLTDPTRARWDLAHECLHMLALWNGRVDGCPANWLEEGLVAWFQNRHVPEAAYHEGQYALADNPFLPLMEEFPSAIKLIRGERRLHINAIKPDVLREYYPGFNDETQLKICQPFQELPEKPADDV